MRCVNTLLFITLLCTCGRAQQTIPAKAWTKKDAARYAQQHNDSTTWNLKMLADDLEWAKEIDSSRVGIASFPSPVPHYDWGYVSSQTLKLSVPPKRIVGYSLAYAHDAYRPRLPQDSSAYYFTAANLFFLTDAPKEETASCTIVSRNAPHYLATGLTPSSIGDIEWVQMHLADGNSFVIIAQRYFDLRQGETIIVAPRQDGSLRFLQLKASPGSVLSGGFSNPINEARREQFQATLSNDERVKEFLLAKDNL